MKTTTTLFCLLLFNQVIVDQTIGQEKVDNRYPYQFYFEDSTHIYWTWYPNPFSGSTLKDTSKGSFCGGLGFYCDNSDTVTVTILTEKDSVVYERVVESQNSPQFELCYWLAGPRINLNRLPVHYFRGDSEKHFKILLSVQGRRKCVRESGINLSKNWYCWIDDIKQTKH